MKTFVTLGAALATLLVSGISGAATTTFTATLNAAQETGVTSAGTGTVTVTLDDVANSLVGAGTYTGLSGEPTSGAHVHVGALCGASSNNAKTITAAGGTITINLTGLSAQEVTDIKAEKAYVNLHTAANGNGEIRGQLFPTGSTSVC